MADASLDGKVGTDSRRAARLAIVAAKWLSGASYDDLPDDVIESTQLRVLDTIGNIAAAASWPLGAQILETARTMSGPGQACVVGTGDSFSAPVAALVNGGLAAALDFDDTHLTTVLHFSSPTVAAALATGGQADGRAFITAVAGASELMCRLGLAAPGGFHKRGFHATGVLGAIGAAAAAARLAGMPAATTANALSIAATLTGGITQAITEGRSVRQLYAGWAAHVGFTAMLLARSGIEGPDAIFEGEAGLFASHLEPQCFRTDLLDGLGETWETRCSSFKAFPCGHVIHPFLEAVFRMFEQRPFEPDEIKSIVCRVPPFAVPMVCEPAGRKAAPASTNEGRVSLQYTLAEAIVRKRLDGSSYQPVFLADPAILALAAKVQYVPDEAYADRQHYGGALEIVLNGGDTITESARARVFTADDVRRKFANNLAGSRIEARAGKIVEAVAGLARLDHVERLVELCRPATHPAQQ